MNPQNVAQSKNINHLCTAQKSSTLVQLDTPVPIKNKHYWYNNTPFKFGRGKKSNNYIMHEKFLNWGTPDKLSSILTRANNSEPQGVTNLVIITEHARN